ncbi:hypothetical protein IFM89_017790 [Coptis chinensis]|uniref:DUF4283 domain-containing protein n=1 Tax=Coptis chinensis TaxID=261450 RepID=A0A835ITX6_9MAGN|nr:hypothetical protein IFM89_017790 [Coptis chinensis]
MPGVQTWSSLFLQNRAVALTRNLKHFTLQEVNGITIILMDLIMQGCTEWSDYVVGFFIEQRLSFTYVKNVLQQRWKDKGNFEIIADKDLFYFKFSNNEASQTVQEEDSFTIELALGDERLISFEYPWIPARCERCQKFRHATEKCSRDANSVRRMNINGTGRVNIRLIYENTKRNTVIYTGNGTGENKRRRIWRVQSRPTSLSKVVGTNCIRNNRGEEIREHSSCPAAQDELSEIPTDEGQTILTEDCTNNIGNSSTQMIEVDIEMNASMQKVVHEPQVEELVLVVQPNPFQLLAGEELEGKSPHETEYFEDHLYVYEKEAEQFTPLEIVMPEPRMTRS